jgi:hypothetical protein
VNKSINLFGARYKIEYIHCEKLDGAYGRILTSFQTIQIADHLIGNERISSLIHEINHQCFNHKAINYILNKEQVDYLCEVFAQGLTTIYYNNEKELIPKDSADSYKNILIEVFNKIWTAVSIDSLEEIYKRKELIINSMANSWESILYDNPNLMEILNDSEN